jgi:HK97 family phage portal protein
MGLLVRAFERKAITDFTDKLLSLLQTTAGVVVDETTALRATAVWACVRVISEDVATLPLFMYERLDRGKRRAPEHPLQPLLHDQPNPEMTALQFRETLTAHLLTWGNAYAYIVRDGKGVPRELWPLLPDRTRLQRDPRTRALFYEIHDTPDVKADPRWVAFSENVLHIAGLGFDGLKGYSPIAMFRQAIGLGMAAEEFGARFFGQGTHMGVTFEHPGPGPLSETAYTRLKTELTEKYGGLGRSHLVMILEEGMKANKLGIPPDEAQFVETRKLQVTEIARIFRVPPHKIMDLERATFSNIEEQGLDYTVSTLRPWLARWEQAIRVKLLTSEERRRFFAEHVVEGLLRGNTQGRYSAYATGRQWGWLSINDIRELENLNPIDGGDAYLEPLNMKPAGSAPPTTGQE